MVERVKAWLNEGQEVRIFTARVSTQKRFNQDGSPCNLDHVRTAIENWCIFHLGQLLEVTCQKDYGCTRLYDDIAVQVVANTGELVG
jgi:hypothetical protein